MSPSDWKAAADVSYRSQQRQHCALAAICRNKCLISGSFLGIPQKITAGHGSGTGENGMAFFAKGKLIAAVGAAALCLLTGVAQAASCGNGAAGFEAWKADFANEARAAGVKGKGLAALENANYASATIKADRAVKKAFSGTVDQFMQRRGGN